jgi:hypothetical protein
MSGQNENHRDHLEVVDTSDKLTVDEIKELKNLAQLSRTAKWIIAGAIGFVSLFGMDKIGALIDHK